MSEIEKQFFETFGIEPKYKTCVFKYCKNKEEYDCDNCDNRKWIYPQITDHILLELIRFYLGKFKIDRFRRFILGIWIDLYEKTININKKKRLKHQVQSLFEEND